MSDIQFVVETIGSVQIDDEESTLVVDEPYGPALTGLDGFSHLHLLWWSHLLDDPMFREMTIAERPYRNASAAIGIFATRSPVRANPIAPTAVSVLSIDMANGLVRVLYIDAEDGIPIVDIRPYHPGVERIRDVRTPAWCAGWPEWHEDSATFDWGSVFENAQ